MKRYLMTRKTNQQMHRQIKVLKTYTVSKSITLPRLQIRGAIEDNSKIISYFIMKTYIVAPHLKCFSKTALMI